MDKYSILQAYISSSEFNRMRKNGIELLSHLQWDFDKDELFKTGTLTKKLKRKLNLLFGIGVLERPKRPLIGLGDSPFYQDLLSLVVKQQMDYEDDIILNGTFDNMPKVPYFLDTHDPAKTPPIIKP